MTNPAIYSDQIHFENPQKLRWQDQALCAQTNPEDFFIEKGGSYAVAKRTCASCLVRSNCREKAMEDEGAALAQDRYGMFGGLTPVQRSELYLERQVTGDPEEEIEPQIAA